MASIAEALSIAMQHHQSGNLQQAEQIYRQILQVDSQHVDALHLLGLIARGVGRNDLAVDYIGQAVRLRPDYAEAHVNLGNALAALGRLGDAVASYQQAIRINPFFADAYNNLGNALGDQGKIEEAVASYQQALRIRPDLAAAHYNLGLALQSQDNRDEAIASYRHAVRIKPDYADAYYNLGLVFKAQGKLDDAVANYQQTLRLKPDYAEAHNNLGIALQEAGKFDEAVECYERAMQAKADFSEPRWNRSMVLLLRGNLEEGWPESEWRWKGKESANPAFSQPLWDGSILTGRTILLHAEQGLGDTLQFIRYASLVKQRGGRVIVQCQKPLTRLLSRCAGIDQLVAQGAALPEFDVQAPLMSLPGILRTTLGTIPADVPYLFVDAELVEHWRSQLSTVREFKIGIAWQGNPKQTLDPHRSVPLVQFAPVAGVAGVQLFSLQKGPGTEQLRDLRDQFSLKDLGSQLDEISGAFMDTAAVMKHLDLVISSDTAIAHLAGALAVPVWVALSFAPDWRWLLDRDDSPWYPTMRLFRQTELGNWRPVFQRMAGELQGLLTN